MPEAAESALRSLPSRGTALAEEPLDLPDGQVGLRDEAAGAACGHELGELCLGLRGDQDDLWPAAVERRQATGDIEAALGAKSMSTRARSGRISSVVATASSAVAATPTTVTTVVLEQLRGGLEELRAVVDDEARERRE
jgi:hypothetical protein